MKNLTKKDSGEYQLRFLTNDGEGFSAEPGVILGVTDLQVRASCSAVASEGQTTVTLSCITSCTLSNNPTYMWYKNGQPVTDKLTKHIKLYLNSSEDAGNYSCAVRGREDLRSPELTVTCEPQNSENSRVLKVIMVGLAVFLAVTLLSGALWMWKRKSSSDNGHSSTGESGQSVPKPGDDTYTALNPMNTSPDYDTLQNIQDSASDTYTTLNPATTSSDYDTLRGVAPRLSEEKYSRTAE
ncbi:sialoadhesin-like [Ictalurus furcatus]|uniref:sialoadhesin-like n=1 Tax=Ictalurus furcatus TaxID=66913 RepID=UPI0023501D3F|nr:sialoadhesin-like [Ictalurus furcatus]